MSKFFISFGLLNKNIYLPIIYIIIGIGINICWDYCNYNLYSFLVSDIVLSIGQISTFFVSHILRYRRVVNKKIDNTKKNYLKDYSFLFLILSVFNIVNSVHVYVGYDKKHPENKYKELYLNYSLDIIIITLVTIFILKYKYYIHHIISIILLTILCVSIDLIEDKYNSLNIPTTLFTIFYAISESLLYTYIKYLIEEKYYFFMSVLVVTGIFNFVFDCILFIIIFIVDKTKNSNEIIFGFYNYYKENGLWNLIFLFLFNFILEGFLSSIFQYSIIKELTPNYFIIAYQFSKIPFTIKENEGWKRWVILVISIFQIITLLFYLEILEYNFCLLNLNTKKNIINRESNEFTGDDNESDIDIKGYRISAGEIKEETKEEKTLEMLVVNESNEGTK